MCLKKYVGEGGKVVIPDGVTCIWRGAFSPAFGNQSTIKNYKAFGKAFPISYNGGYTLYINNNSENVRGTWMNAFKVPATE